MAGNTPQRHPDVDVLIDEIDMLFDQQLTNAITGLLQSAAPDLNGCFCESHARENDDCFYAPCSADCDCEDAYFKKIEPLGQINEMHYVPSWVTIDNGQIMGLKVPSAQRLNPHRTADTHQQTQALMGSTG